jgi:hypothetical protein
MGMGLLIELGLSVVGLCVVLLVLYLGQLDFGGQVGLTAASAPGNNWECPGCQNVNAESTSSAR